ncbi:hypothetical protein [Bacillus phage vB_BanS-Thrax5]|nr:hypothetical protein [Bacillus phage vB_BanS-Thrax5]
MLRKAYFLMKNNKKMSKFFLSQLELQEKCAEQLKKEGYSIGMMEFSHTEEKDETEYLTLWTDDSGLIYSKRGQSFYANQETCWGEAPETWHTKIEVDIRDTEKLNDVTVRIKDGARIRILDKYTNESIKELKKKLRQDYLENLKPFIVGKNRIRVYVNSAGADLIESGWHSVACFYDTEHRSPSVHDYIVEVDIDKTRAGHQRGSIRVDGTHHIKIIGKFTNEG